MRAASANRLRRGALALLLCSSLGGCSTIKWIYQDRATGETWWIKHTPLSSDEITYCAPAGSGPVMCRTAAMLDGPPRPGSG